jgi:poly-D-alanine transfer protein DltD
MTPNEVEELRYDVAHHLLSKMSAGSQFQYALDRMLDMCKDYTEKELKEMLPKQKKKTKGGGF